ncbi:hypothetical protein RJT34_04329 [Clitoria ternatea]|uniref:F-box domain-containing protein n=1 Tax=Clitoria ternatea TaxID=43366 RepID=A0AAN9KMF0_CLITE
MLLLRCFFICCGPNKTRLIKIKKQKDEKTKMPSAWCKTCNQPAQNRRLPPAAYLENSVKLKPTKTLLPVGPTRLCLPTFPPLIQPPHTCTVMVHGIHASTYTERAPEATDKADQNPRHTPLSSPSSPTSPREFVIMALLGFEGYSYTRALGRKRVVVSNNVETSSIDSNSGVTPLKRMCSGKITFNCERSRLEALPLDVLIRVLCSVDHEDLEQLVHVSKVIREAAEIARRLHFEYSTPKKKTFAIRSPFDVEGSGWYDEIEPPSAPLRKSSSRLSGKNLAGVSVALFASTNEGQ